MGSPLISFIVPTYNGIDTIDECIGSLLGQECAYPYEIILVDDGSTDGTSEAAARYSSYEKVSVIRQENSGHTAARLAGLKRASGEYIFFIDCDDLVCTDAVKVLGELIGAYDPDAVVFAYSRLSDRGERKVTTGIPAGCYPENDWNELKCRMLMMDEQGRNIPFALWSKIYRREIILNAVKRVPYEILTGEDICCSVGAFLECRSVYFTDDMLYRYRVSKTSLSRRPSADSLNRCLYTVGFLFDCICIEEALRAQVYRLSVQQVYSAALRTAKSMIDKKACCRNMDAVLDNELVIEAVKNARFSDKRLRLKRFLLRHRLYSAIWFLTNAKQENLWNRSLT